MTIGGALSELNNFLKADDIPFYYKPSIKKVIETIEQDAIELRIGHWVNLYSDNYKCSECGDWWKGEEIKECNYCPHCGSYNGGGTNMKSGVSE